MNDLHSEKFEFGLGAGRDTGSHAEKSWSTISATGPMNLGLLD